MARQFQPAKKVIYVFCEGESEQAYLHFLKDVFHDVAVLKYPKSTGVFEFALDKFTKDSKYRNSIDVVDEIWLFFDVEISEQNKWEKRYEIIKQLRNLKKKPRIRVRLLMTSACVEYWFLLHYKMTTPPLHTVTDKERTLQQLRNYVPDYKKGDEISTGKIAANYPTAIHNGKQAFSALLSDGLPYLEDTDERNQWLALSGKTFTTVQEAIEYLENLRAR